jgi:hypothetical protein
MGLAGTVTLMLDCRSPVAGVGLSGAQ